MIAAHTCDGIDRLFHASARECLTVRAEDIIEVTAFPTGADPRDGPHQLVFLTISSYRFRLLTLFGIQDTPALRNHFLRDKPSGDLASVFGEYGNLCCGAMNRELGKHFPHLGMSTPAVLDARSLHYIEALKPHHVSHHRISINQSAELQATVCVCAYDALDFRVDLTSAGASAGALELF